MPLSKKALLRGFTLIELLVVIAIIGILSAVVLGSLALARQKAGDSTIKSNLHTIQSQMEIIYSNNGGSYGATVSASPNPVSAVTGTSVFVTDAAVNGAMKSALVQTAAVNTSDSACGFLPSGGGAYAVGATGGSWAAAVSLKTNACKYWCVDSSGTPKLEANYPALGGGAAAAACP